MILMDNIVEYYCLYLSFSSSILQLLTKIVLEKTARANEPTRAIHSAGVIYSLKGLPLLVCSVNEKAAFNRK